ncbi:hypothetical protein [Streptomyces sp. NPDC051546]|uniref:hypothetical protein n=1 Tax=Streptomyces sp. NPDC051546 TaxID=3365655 RepID=UPI0037BCC350
MADPTPVLVPENTPDPVELTADEIRGLEPYIVKQGLWVVPVSTRLDLVKKAGAEAFIGPLTEHYLKRYADGKEYLFEKTGEGNDAKYRYDSYDDDEERARLRSRAEKEAKGAADYTVKQETSSDNGATEAQLLSLLPAEKLAELLKPLDEAVTAEVERKIAEVVVERDYWRGVDDARRLREEIQRGGAAADLPDDKVKGRITTTERAPRAYGGYGGSFLAPAGRFPSGYEFEDVSDTWEGYFVLEGNDFWKCLPDRGNAQWMSFTYDKRTQWWVQTGYLNKV